MRRVGRPAVAPRYLVAGQTHPKVLQEHGEAYRDGLRERAAALGVDHLGASSTPPTGAAGSWPRWSPRPTRWSCPTSRAEQVASGVLIEAVAARRPVIATAFPHAAEMLADGTGLLVPHRDARAISAAIRRVLTEPGLAESMEHRAAQIAPTLDWEAVADRYRLLATGLTADLAPKTAPHTWIRTRTGPRRTARHCRIGASAVLIPCRFVPTRTSLLSRRSRSANNASTGGAYCEFFRHYPQRGTRNRYTVTPGRSARNSRNGPTSRSR